MSVIRIINTDSSSALYVDGKKQLQDDVIFAEFLAEFCPIVSIEDDWTDKFMDFPETIQECMELDSDLFQ